jgi:hypothetical protein
VASTTTDHMIYDYGDGNEKAKPAEIAITCTGGGTAAYAPTDFDLVYSDDGAIWTVQQHYTSPATWTDALQRTFSVT